MVQQHAKLTAPAIRAMKSASKITALTAYDFQTASLLDLAGIFALVLECIPSQLAQRITSQLSIPTIGIGAGPHCDEQILVVNDLLGMGPEQKPKFVKQYANLNESIKNAAKDFIDDVKENKYPSEKHAYT